MAKNLKLKIKNTQLAEALKLGKITKTKEAKISKKPKVEKPTPKKEPEEIKEPDTIEAALEPELAPAEHVAEPSRKEPPIPEEKLEPVSKEKPAERPEEEVRKPEFKEPPVKRGLSTLVKARPESYVPHKPYQKLKKPTAPTPKKEEVKPAAAPLTVEEETEKKGGKKVPGFKEYRDIKPQKRQQMQTAFDSRARQGLRDVDEGGWRRKRPHQRTKNTVQEEEIIRPKELSIRIPISVKDLAQQMKLKASELISKLFMQGVILTLNDYLDDETTIQLLGQEFGCEITIDTTEEERLRITDKTIKEEITGTPPDKLTLRPPVVTFMGHVDHGKTSLIDAIRKTNIAAKEAGAITQHIGAFKCHTAVGNLTILDTPGHEAFSAMRSRGAEVTDIVVLVIAGDEGIRQQTIEAIQQTKDAGVPILVAINKCDKPNFNAEDIYRQLAEQNLLPEVWGGTTITVNCSALTKTGIKELLEMLALQAEVLELKANPNERARGTVIESQMHKGLGAVATLLVQNGTLHLGDALVFNQCWGCVKTMHDEFGNQIFNAPPSCPIKVTGLSNLPEAGNEFFVVPSEKEAKQLSEARNEELKHKELYQSKRNLEKLLQQKSDIAKKKIINVILRTDVQGSLEALKNSLRKIPAKKVEINFISPEVGEISEADIELAAASHAVIIGFHTRIEQRAEPLIKQLKVKVKLHDIIYHVVDDVKEMMLALLDKIPQENEKGKAHVIATFKSSKLGTIAGCMIDDGTIRRNHHIRILRNGQKLWQGEILSMKREANEVNEAHKGVECGFLFKGFSSPQLEDVLEAFEVTYLSQTLED